MPRLNDYLSVGQAATYLGVSKATHRRWDRSGKLTAHRHPVTKFRLYLKEDLDEILDGVTLPDGELQRGEGKRPRKRGR